MKRRSILGGAAKRRAMVAAGKRGKDLTVGRTPGAGSRLKKTRRQEMHRKPVITAQRQARLLSMLRQRKTLVEIMREMEMSYSTLMQAIEQARKGCRGEQPSFLPPNGVKGWTPEKAERSEALTKLAKKAILGEKAGKKEKLPAVFSKTKKAGQRRKERRTGILKKAERKKILTAHMREIRKKASELYNEHPKTYKAIKVSEKTFERELRERLDWKLQTWPGSKEIKLEEFFRNKMAVVAYDLKTTALKISLRLALKKAEAGLETKKRKHRLAKLEKASKTLGLDVLWKAVMFGVEAGLTNRRMAGYIGHNVVGIGKTRKEVAERRRKLNQE